MSIDTLSDVLRSVRLRGAVFFRVSGGEHWATHAPGTQEIAAAVMPGVEHVMEYHVITKGQAWGAIAGQPPVRLATGDVVMFPQGDPHVISSAPHLAPTPDDPQWFHSVRDHPKPIAVNFHGVGAFSLGEPPADARTTVICGFLGCDARPFNPLCAALPRLMHLPAASGDWTFAVLQQAVAASRERRPGSDALLERVSEMMFVEGVRRYVESLPGDSTGWLAGLRDRHVGRALALLHAEPAREWTVDALAREAAISRSALYDRFVQFIGVPPMQYLTQWRMQVAARLLRDGQAPVASIALEVGYESEAAFSRAFKRETGRPPATWRREIRSAA